MNALLGKKIGMTQLYDEAGNQVPVTLVQGGPCTVMQVKTEEKDGYNALQLGFGDKKRKRARKTESGHAKKAKAEPKKVLMEVRVKSSGEYELGQELTAAVFEGIEKVDVVGTSKGRGFSGHIRRHGFSRGPMTHGSKSHRRRGSTGMCEFPGRVFKGTRMSGQYGNTRSTVRNLKVVKLDVGKNLLALGGAIPGHNGSFVMIRKCVREREDA